jgi:translation elongation factor EF-Ts
LADLADVAMHVAAEPNVISYISTPQKVLRSERDVKNRSSYSVFELSDTGLLIEQFDDAQQGGR